MNNISISAVVPAHNEEKSIADCLNSLINQTRKFNEIIVVDDGSSDRTVEIVKKLPVRLIELKENKGCSYARNVGLSKVKSQFILFGEADAIYAHNFVELCLKQFSKQNIAGVIGKQEVWNKDENIWTRCKAAEREANFVNYKPFSAWLYRTKLVKDVNGFDESLNFGEDVDLANRIKAKGYDIAYEPSAIWKHYEPPNMLQLIKRQWQFGLNMRKFYEKWGFPKKVIFLDCVFFCSALLGLFYSIAWAICLIYFLARLLAAKKCFYFIDKKYYLFLAIFLIVPALVFKFGRLIGILNIKHRFLYPFMRDRGSHC